MLGLAFAASLRLLLSNTLSRRSAGKHMWVQGCYCRINKQKQAINTGTATDCTYRRYGRHFKALLGHVIFVHFLGSSWSKHSESTRVNLLPPRASELEAGASVAWCGPHFREIRAT